MNKQYTFATLLLLSFSFSLFACEKDPLKKPNSSKKNPIIYKRCHNHGSLKSNIVTQKVPFSNKGKSYTRIAPNQQVHKGLTQEEIQQKNIAILHDTLYGV